MINWLKVDEKGRKKDLKEALDGSEGDKNAKKDKQWTKNGRKMVQHWSENSQKMVKNWSKNGQK